MEKRFPITKSGYKKLEKEIKELKTTERNSILEAIKTAREYGDLSENAEYHAAKERQAFVEGRITELEDKLARAEIIEIEKITGTSIKFGATVLLFDCDSNEEVRYKIVGDYEADTSKGLISISAPLAKSLIGKSKNDEITVATPKNSKVYEVLDVMYKEFEI